MYGFTSRRCMVYCIDFIADGNSGIVGKDSGIWLVNVCIVYITVIWIEHLLKLFGLLGITQ